MLQVEQAKQFTHHALFRADTTGEMGKKKSLALPIKKIVITKILSLRIYEV